MSNLKEFNNSVPFDLKVNPIPDTNTLTMYHGKATDTLAKMNSREASINPITGSAIIEQENVKVVIQQFKGLGATLGVNTHKLLSVAISEFTANNNYTRKGESTSVNYEVQIPLEPYATRLGYKLLPEPCYTPEEAEAEKKRAYNALKEAKKNIRKDQNILGNMTITWEEKVKGKAGDYQDIKIIGSKGIRNGYINMTFDPKFASYLLKLPETQYPMALLGIDGRNSNAYKLGLKFAVHFNMDNNQRIGTADRLKVETLLKCTNLPSYEDVLGRKGSWEERIKEPFHNALDELTRKGVLKDWKYVGSKGVELTDREATSNVYEEWKELYIMFELGDTIDHTERLARNDVKKAKARAKKSSKKK